MGAFLEEGSRRWDLPGEPVFIGRDPACVVQLIDEALSRQHALLVPARGGWELIDYKSRNGVRINDAVVLRAVLTPGDRIGIGAHTLTFGGDDETIRGREAMSTIFDALRGEEEARDGGTTFLGVNDRSVSKLLTLYQVSKIINSHLDLPELLETVMDQALKVMRADRGIVLLSDPETGEMVPRASRAMQADEAVAAGGPMSQSILRDVVDTGEPMLTDDAMADSRFDGAMSIVAQNIRSALGVPLKNRQGELLGVLYVDNRIESDAFDDEDLKLLSAFADQAAIAVENARLVERLQEETRRRTLLSRFLSPGVVEKVIDSRNEVVPGGEKTTAAVLFCDIRSFTPFAETRPPEEVVGVLNEFLSAMTRCVFDHGGTLDKYTGDGVMALFGVPFPMNEPARAALGCAVAMQEGMERLRTAWAARKGPALRIGVAVHLGELVAGYMGSEERIDYTAIGDTVNTAARIEDVTPPDAICLSEAVRLAAGDGAATEPMPPVPLKGKRVPLAIHRLVALHEDPDRTVQVPIAR